MNLRLFWVVTEMGAVWISRRNSVRFLFVRYGEERSFQKLLAWNSGAAASRKDVKTDWDEQGAIYADDVQSVLMLTVGFSYVYCELWQICRLTLQTPN